MDTGNHSMLLNWCSKKEFATNLYCIWSSAPIYSIILAIDSGSSAHWTRQRIKGNLWEYITLTSVLHKIILRKYVTNITMLELSILCGCTQDSNKRENVEQSPVVKPLQGSI